ncbi:MAG TPA: hypothetical protein VGO43_13645 [Pyrinomonadaceae bacterium]|jgi:hypothetical protein|nr:hypothetical protein [Pyrinomonadaceae bacterium]
MLNFISSVWASRLLTALEKALVYGQTGVVNRDYEGEITAAGDTVKIGSIGDPTIGDYVKDVDITAQVLTDAEMTLLINQAKYFNFVVDDLDKTQQNVNAMDEAMSRAAYKLRDVADQFIAANYSLVPAGNLVGSDGSPIAALAASAAYDHLVNLSVKLDEANIPSEGRFAVVPPFFHGALLKDTRFVGTGGMNAEQTLRNGQIGEAAGFSILKSNNAPIAASTKYKIIAGHPMAYSYAEQISKVETYRKEKGFGDGVKGLHVYGGKLVRPTAWAVGTVTNAAS